MTQAFRVTNADDVVVETGGQPVIIDKLFGPAIVCRVKVTLDLKAGQWVVFREVDPTPEGVDQWPLFWVEAARFSLEYAGQLPSMTNGDPSGR